MDRDCGFITDKPSVARIYDYLLGGTANFPADRAAAEQVAAAAPYARSALRANRAFLYRAVRHMAGVGIRQFLDIGSGMPTNGSVHETAAEVDGDARTVYVDFDPVAVHHSRALLADNPNVTVIQADLREPDSVLEKAAMLDLTQPVGLLLVAVLHFVEDADALPAMQRLREALAPGSYLAITHAVTEGIAAQGVTREAAAKIASVYQASNTASIVTRTIPEVATLFGPGANMEEPGLVWVNQWRPDDAVTWTDDPAKTAVVAGIACLG